MWILELFLVSLGFLTFAFLSNLSRSKRHFPIELRPNCLLTRYPLVFATGRKSIFYFLAYWNKTPEFLKQHGYEVLEFNLPWRNKAQRKMAWLEFAQWLEKENQKCHLLIDGATSVEIQEIWTERPAVFQTLTVVSAASKSRIRAQDLKPLALGFEFLEIKTKNNSQASWMERSTWFFHKITAGAQSATSPLSLGLSAKDDQDPVFHQYLDLCIALAERDVR
ncbi:MAG: hypothetical protein AB7H97_10040 [Pseudobdellovibrionaceae bacterium]